MDAREGLTPVEWFSFLEREETRKEEWGKILNKFKQERFVILEAFLGMEDGGIRNIVSDLLKHSFIYFYQEPQYEEAMRVAEVVPRDSGVI